MAWQMAVKHNTPDVAGRAGTRFGGELCSLCLISTADAVQHCLGKIETALYLQ